MLFLQKALTVCHFIYVMSPSIKVLMLYKHGLLLLWNFTLLPSLFLLILTKRMLYMARLLVMVTLTTPTLE